MWYLFVIATFIIIVTFCVAMRMNRYELDRPCDPLRKNYLQKQGALPCFLLMLTLFLLVALRNNNIGTDTQAYLAAFSNVVNNGMPLSRSHMEYGYQLFEYVISLFFKDSQAILIFSALFIYGLYWAFIRKYSVNPWFMSAIFFAVSFSGSTNVIRHTMAQIIILYAYQAYKENKLKKAIIITLIAGSVHTVGLAFLAWIVIAKFDFKPILFSACAGVALLLAVSGKILLSLLRTVFFMYANYFTADRIGDGWLAVSFGLLKILVVATIYVLGTYPRERSNATKWLLGIALLFEICGYVLNIFSRVTGIFWLVSFVPVCNEMLLSKKKNGPALMLFLIVFLTACFLFTVWYRPDWNYLYPYQFFFSNK